MVTVSTWEELNEAIRQLHFTEAGKYVDSMQRIAKQEGASKQAIDHANNCERNLLFALNGLGWWKEAFELAQNSVKGEQTKNDRLKRIKQVMEAKGEQFHGVYAVVIKSLDA